MVLVIPRCDAESMNTGRGIVLSFAAPTGPRRSVIPRCDAESREYWQGECPFLCRPDWTPHRGAG